MASSSSTWCTSSTLLWGGPEVRAQGHHSGSLCDSGSVPALPASASPSRCLGDTSAPRLLSRGHRRAGRSGQGVRACSHTRTQAHIDTCTGKCIHMCRHRSKDLHRHTPAGTPPCRHPLSTKTHVCLYMSVQVHTRHMELCDHSRVVLNI